MNEKLHKSFQEALEDSTEEVRGPLEEVSWGDSKLYKELPDGSV